MNSPVTVEQQLKLATIFRWAIIGKYERAEAELDAAGLTADQLVPMMMAANWMWTQAKERILEPAPPSHGTELQEREVGAG
jgi:hypothetical protein